MLGIMEVRLNFVTSFCGEYGRCWLWSKMEPELQNWCSRGGGEYAAADKSFFSVTRRAFLRRQTTLCPIFSSMISVVYCVARCICCVVLFASHCNDIGSGGKCTEKSESSTIFIIIFITQQISAIFTSQQHSVQFKFKCLLPVLLINIYFNTWSFLM